jgi:hypothetical protein
MRRNRLPIALTCCAVALAAGSAAAQLRPDEVLVVYDSRIADSLAVAEYYAGSAKVPGGAGGLPGARPGVRVMNLNGLAAVTAPGNIAYASFAPQLRDPIRTFLTTNGLAQRVRCLVLTKGLPHRVLDSDNPTVGDFPGNVGNEFLANDMNCASVDAELTLLWQDLTAGEAGGGSDSKSDGCILNPFWRASQSITTFTNINNQSAKTLTASGSGPLWLPSGTITAPTRLGAGDLYLVGRLDGRTLADVRGIIDRGLAGGAGILVNTQTSVFIFDESDSNGITDVTANGEFDNINGTLPGLWDSDDYEKTRDVLTADNRWQASLIRYNALAAFNQFFVGPRLTWMASHGILVTDPVILLAHYGLNHTGQPMTTDNIRGGIVYPLSFNYAPGAVFNSLESFNCRDFGGLGTLSFAPQGQASDFISAGGTFAVGNVWEPLADTVPDNRFLAQNFLLGGMCWAEAAWSAVPSLSWMQIAVGDPLARIERSSEDVNGDGRVDVADLYAWERAPSDINRSGAADAADRTLLVRSVRTHERSGMLLPR